MRKHNARRDKCKIARREPNKLLPPDRTVPKQLSKWCLQHRWKEIDAVDAEMIGEFKKKYGLK